MRRLRSLLTLGSSDVLASIDERLKKLEDDIASLRTLVRSRDDRATEKLKAGLSSVANLMAILPQLRINGVIPPFPHQGFELTGEEASFLYHLIRRQRPRLIMELGSGSSTVLLAAAVRANGIGRVISVEHAPEHADRTAQVLAQAELSEWVQVVRAPLVEQRVDERKLQWYDVDALLSTLTEKIDFLLVDGPPGKMQSLSRYPALPVLLPHLSPQALVFVDDGGREDEIKMVELWRERDDVAFAAEALSFLPKTPILLTMTRSGSVAEFPSKDERADLPAREEEFFGQGRRSGVS